MIPQVIHYCWFGGREKPAYVQECIESWRQYLPDFQVVEWNEENSPTNSAFVEHAVQSGLWAFVADYARVEILKRFGGLYLDTDMLFVRTLPKEFLDCDAFIGCEDENTVNAAIIGSIANGSFINDLSSYYNSLGLVTNYADYLIPQIVTHRVLQLKKPVRRVVTSHNLIIYPSDFFYPYPLKAKGLPWPTYLKAHSISVHLWAGSWVAEVYGRNAEWLETASSTVGDIEAIVPAGSVFILVDCDQLPGRFSGRSKLPFLEKCGKYWGPPADDHTAIRELKRLRQFGPELIIFAWPAFWYFDCYPKFFEYIQSNFTCLLQTERLVVFKF